MKRLGIGGHFLMPEDANHPAARFVRECCETDAQPGDVIEYRVRIVTNERQQREVRRSIAQQQGTTA